MDNKEKYYSTKEFHEILNRYEESLKTGKQVYFESDELTDIAEYYYKEGRFDDAVATLDYAIRLHPGSAMPLVFRDAWLSSMRRIPTRHAITSTRYPTATTSTASIWRLR